MGFRFTVDLAEAVAVRILCFFSSYRAIYRII